MAEAGLLGLEAATRAAGASETARLGTAVGRTEAGALGITVMAARAAVGSTVAGAKAALLAALLTMLRRTVEAAPAALGAEAAAVAKGPA